MTGSFEKWTVIAVVVFNAYSLGANGVERFVNYQSWPKLADAEFGPYHRSQQPWIIGFVVAPLAFAFLLQVLLLTSRLDNIPLWIVLILNAASIVGFISTIAIQIPIHRQLDQGYSPRLIARLLTTVWIRKCADLIRLLGIVALLRHCLS